MAEEKNLENQQSQKELELMKKIENLEQQVNDQGDQNQQEQEKKEQEEREREEQEQMEKLKEEAKLKGSLSKSDEGVDFDELSNKELLDIIGDAFDKSVDARTKIALEEGSKNNKALEDKLSNIEKYLMQKEASSGIENARAKFSDFDEYKDDISKIFERYPGMTPEDAYVLAKGNKASDSPPQKHVETEKPVSLGTRAEAAEKRYADKKGKEKESKPTNRRDFRDLIRDMAEKVISEK